METAVINKEELLSILGKIDTQLEELDHKIASQAESNHNEWILQQKSQIEFCGKQLDLLDKKITSIKEYNQQSQSTSIRFKFSY
jgi:uncharacterized coiled-coil protein SlyX